MALTTVKSDQIQTSVALAGSPTTTTQSASDNSTKIATTAYADTAVANLVASAPSALNTLDELAAALNDDASFSTTVTNSIATKLPLAGGTMSGALNMGSQNITNAGTIAGTLTTAAQTNITSLGTLSGLTVTNPIAGSVTGTAATVTGAAQTNITSVGTLSSLTVSGALNGTLSTAAQTNITSVGTLSNLTTSGFAKADNYQFYQNSSATGATDAIYRKTTATLAFKTGSTERMTLDGSGNLVVTGGLTGSTLTGTLSTAAQTNITSLGTLTGLNTTGDITITGSGNTALLINTGNNSGDNSQIKFGDTADDDVGQINYDHGTNAMQFRTNAASNTLVLDSSQNATFAGTVDTGGDITVTKNSARVRAIESGGATTQIASGGATGYVGTYSNHSLQILSNSTAAITIDTSQNATFGGNIIGSDIKAAGSGGLTLQTDEGTKRLEILDSGNIAVNLSSFSAFPTNARFTVFGDGEVLRIDGSGATTRKFRFRNVSDANPGVIVADGSLKLETEDANTDIRLSAIRDIEYQTTSTNSTAGDHKFKIYNTEAMVIKGSTNQVKIGPLATASATSAPLHVAVANQDVQAIFGDNNDSIDDPQIRIIGRNTGNSSARYTFMGLDADNNYGQIGYNAGSGAFQDALRMHTQGYVTTPNQPCAVRQVGGGGIVNLNCNAQYYRLAFTSSHRDQGSMYGVHSGGGSKFTAPVAGVYFFSCVIRVDDFSGNYLYLDGRVNGTTVSRNLTALTGNYLSYEVSGVYYLGVGDYFTFEIANSGDTSVDVDDSSMVYIHLLG